ncbi:MAG: hypothetical protein JSS14_24550 [Proteobacteria bacterium]|nr:hypothetical protein [Pseudomonadota bacterium]
MTKAAIVLLAGVLAGTSAAAQDAPATEDKKEAWEFTATAYPTSIRNGDSYTSAIFTADRGALHLEARYNYESVGARSAFVGWNFSGGSEGGLSWELTPMLGGAWGTTDAVVPGLKATVGLGRFDFYTEIEYVRPDDQSSRYLYAWNEFGFKPAEWLRMGAAVQRTRAYGGDRSAQVGPFAQVTWSHFTLGGYWFNPGASDQVVVMSLGVSF